MGLLQGATPRVPPTATGQLTCSVTGRGLYSGCGALFGMHSKGRLVAVNHQLLQVGKLPGGLQEGGPEWRGN